MKVSIIIPSAGRRAEFLKRAINSALIDDDLIQTEIIVVLNGDKGMKFDISLCIQHPLVHYYKIKDGNVSKARNFGIEIAKGELIRFLDDDDFLYPDVAYQQYLEFFHSDADLITYSGAIEDNIQRYQVIEPVKNDDYHCAVMSANCPALTFATVYKSKSITLVRWNEKSNIAEDEEWMRKIAYNEYLRWEYSSLIVGVWFQHSNERLSFNLGHPLYYKNRAESIINLLNSLETRGILTQQRKVYAAQGLWSAIHGAFHFSPVYWSKILFFTRKLDPTSVPNIKFFNKFSLMHPFIFEFLLIPIRWVSRILKKILLRYNRKSYIRRPKIPKDIKF